MDNPWEMVSLSDYEEHMRSSDVYQLQTLNRIIKKQISSHPVKTIAVLGIAGGNGLEYIDTTKIKKVYAIDINSDYLSSCKERYAYLGNCLQLLRLDLASQSAVIPRVDLMIANLFIEYIGIEAFTNHILNSKPTFVSCVIQKSTTDEFVSNSPYTSALTGIAAIHKDIDKDDLIRQFERIHMHLIDYQEIMLPNKKMFLRLDFQCESA